jgi:hypothetical protein
VYRIGINKYLYEVLIAPPGSDFPVKTAGFLSPVKEM